MTDDLILWKDSDSPVACENLQTVIPNGVRGVRNPSFLGFDRDGFHSWPLRNLFLFLS
jgi:hypothetical protein